MSFYRQTERGMWGDEVVRDASRDAKLLWAYLCCNDHDDLSGIYRLSYAMVEDELGLTRDEFTAALSELSSRVSYDARARVVWVHNMLKKQGGTRDGGIGSKHIEHARRQLEALPSTDLKVAMCDYYLRKFGKEIGYPAKVDRAEGPAIGSARLGSASESVSASESAADPPPPPDTPPPTPRVTLVTRAGDPDIQLAAKLADAACLAHVDHRSPRGLFATAVECQEHGAPLDEILAVLAAHALDTTPSRPDRVRMLWARNWPDTRARYLDGRVPGETRDPVAEALELAEKGKRDGPHEDRP